MTIFTSANYPRSTSSIILHLTGNSEYDVAALTDTVAEAASRGVAAKPIGTMFMNYPADEPAPWFDWGLGSDDPVYGCVPLVSGTTLDLTEATIKGGLPRPSWMTSTTRNAWFYTPFDGGSDQGQTTDINIIGGVIDYNRTADPPLIPAFTYGFGFFATDRFSLVGTKFLGEVGTRRYRAFFMRNCRWPRLIDLEATWISQMWWQAFTDYGYMSNVRCYELSECFDFDQPAKGWEIRDISSVNVDSAHEQIFDMSSVSDTLIDGINCTGARQIVQAYTKPSSWVSYAEQYRRRGGPFAVTFDLGADTMTFDPAPTDPTIIEDGAHIEFYSGTLATGTALETLYYLINCSGTTCQLSLTEGGAAVALSGSPANVTLSFRPTVVAPVDNVTVANVTGADMAANGYAAEIAEPYSSGRAFSKDQTQIKRFTLQNWDVDGTAGVLVNEGENVNLLGVTIRNARPVGGTPTSTDYAFIGTQYLNATTAEVERHTNVVVAGCAVLGSTGGGMLFDGVASITANGLVVDGFTGVAWAVFTVTGGTSSPGVNKVSDITVNSVSILDNAVDWVTSNADTAAALVVEINSSQTDYEASSDGAVVTITALSGGVAPVVVVTAAGDVTASAPEASDTRKGIQIIRTGLVSGANSIDNVLVARCTVADGTYFVLADASVTDPYTMWLPTKMRFVGTPGLAYTPLVIDLDTADSRLAIQNRRQVYFNEAFDTAASATLTKLIHGQLGVNAQIVACSIHNSAPGAATVSNNSKVTLVKSTAGVAVDVANGSIIVDYAASGIAADSDRDMASFTGTADANSLIEAGSTLKAVVAANAGSSVTEPFMLNIALIEYVSD